MHASIALLKRFSYSQRFKHCLGQIEATTDSGVAHSNSCSALAYHPTLPLFLTASYDGSVKLWKSSVCVAEKAGSDAAGSYQKREQASHFANR
jgi:WD40 repeat protein